MPTKKAAPSASRALTVWEQRMAQAAEKSAKAERPVSGLSGISTKSGVLTVDEKPVPGNELDVVVLVAVHENQKFDGPYNPNAHQIPSCYAFGDPDAEDPEGSMAPHEESTDKQGDDNGLCANCWANAMGSDPGGGRGKACKNVRRLALITADCLESAADIRDAEVRVLKVPTMSTKGWAMYVRQTLNEELHRPYWGVVTTIKVVPDPKSQFKITFAFKELIDFDDEKFEALERQINVVKPQLTTPYVQMAEAPPPPPPARGRAAPARPAPAAQPLRPQGRAAQAMAASVAGKGKPAPAAAPAKKAKY